MVYTYIILRQLNNYQPKLNDNKQIVNQSIEQTKNQPNNQFNKITYNKLNDTQSIIKIKEDNCIIS